MFMFFFFLLQNRPLAHIENHYRYIPPQPVLSCRTVEVDISGTRTYRAKSAAEIIEEQQRLIHHVYKQARLVTINICDSCYI